MKYSSKMKRILSRFHSLDSKNTFKAPHTRIKHGLMAPQPSDLERSRSISTLKPKSNTNQALRSSPRAYEKFNICLEDRPSFDRFINLLKSLKYINTLNIFISSDFNNAELSQLINKVRSLKSIKTLRITFKENEKGEINDNSLLILATRIKVFKNMSSLILTFANCNRITDEGHKHLFEGVIPIPKSAYLK